MTNSETLIKEKKKLIGSVLHNFIDKSFNNPPSLKSRNIVESFHFELKPVLYLRY